MEHQSNAAEAIERRCDLQHNAQHNRSVFLFKDAQLSPFVFLRIQTQSARVACLQLHRWVSYPWAEPDPVPLLQGLLKLLLEMEATFPTLAQTSNHFYPPASLTKPDLL